MEEDLPLHTYICEFQDHRCKCKNYAIKKVNVANYEKIRVCAIHYKFFMEK